ncbi:MAG: hypothetical protein ACT4O1_03460 [Gemmatimonadota bacterium]
MRRISMLFLCLGFAACDALTGVADSSKNADGTYRGDFQVRSTFYVKSPTGGFTYETKTITGAVGFTIQGGKVITTPVAGDGTTTWDHVNKTMWVDFQSIASSNETHCSKWRYYGGLLESDQFLKGEGGISCVAPDDVFVSFSAFPQTYWKVTRQ